MRHEKGDEKREGDLLLLRVDGDLVGETDAAALLGEVDDDATAFF